MRMVLWIGCAVVLTSPVLAYIHVPPQTLKAMCADSSQIRSLTVKKRDGVNGMIVFEVAEVLRAKKLPAVASFRLVIRPDTAATKTILDQLTIGK